MPIRVLPIIVLSVLGCGETKLPADAALPDVAAEGGRPDLGEDLPAPDGGTPDLAPAADAQGPPPDAQDAGADLFLTKPFSPLHLLRLVDRIGATR